MNRRTFTASLAGLLGVVGMGAKAKAAPTKASGVSGTVTAWGAKPSPVHPVRWSKFVVTTTANGTAIIEHFGCGLDGKWHKMGQSETVFTQSPGLMKIDYD